MASLAWYLVHSKPRQEGVALENLERQGYPCYLPRLRVQKVRRGKAVVISEPLFARYLFVQLDASGRGRSWAPIQSTLGVSRLVRFGPHAARADDELIAQLRAHEHSSAVTTLFQPGDKVMATAGPFAGIAAVYQMADAQQRAIILIELMSKPVAVPVDSACLVGA